MARYIDANVLYEKFCKLDSQALHHVGSLDPKENREEWIKWTAILKERSAYKHDVYNAPTVDVPDTNVGDMIIRQAAIDAIHKAVLEMFDFCDDIIEEPLTYTEETMLEVNKLFTDTIRNLPSAQVERKKGKWSRPFKGDDDLYYETCNRCGRNSLVDLENNFCPNCGADMRGDHNG